MKGWRQLLPLISVLSVPELDAQARRSATLDPITCPYADSLLGPLHRQQRRAIVTASYSRSIDTGSYISGSTAAPQVVAVSSLYAGRGPQQPNGQLIAVFPARVLDQTTETPRFVAIIDDSIRRDHGIVPVPRISGPRPTSWTATILLQPEDFRTLAGARTLVLEWRGARVTAPRADLAGINAVYRMLVCGRPHPSR